MSERLAQCERISCKNGHDITDDKSVYIRKRDGYRTCRKCHNATSNAIARKRLDKIQEERAKVKKVCAYKKCGKLFVRHRRMPNQRCCSWRCSERRWRDEIQKKSGNVWDKVATALEQGKIVKQPCEVCGALKVHAHHRDYSKPLEVAWLCPKHHWQEHRMLRRQHAA